MCDFLFQLTSSFEVQGSSLFCIIQVDTNYKMAYRISTLRNNEK